MTSINNAQLTNDSNVTNSDTNDYFGMEMNYHTDAGNGNNLYYNGNVSSIKWKNAGVATGATDQKSYKFAYDKTDKLTSATFQKYSGSAWNKEQNTFDETMGYDHNGNILTLQRKQNVHGLSGTTVTSTATTIDNLTYTYASGNQLSKVEDAALSAGFYNGSNTTTEYTYDTHGNMTADANKGISAITYNVLGKAQQITFNDGRVVNYTYDASGSKLKVATTVSGTTTATDYANGFVYNTASGTTALSFFPSPEGRVAKNGSNYEYQYAITDHQGNTRVLFTSAAQSTQSVTAGFESANQTTEASNFNNYQTGAHINTVATNAHSGSNSLYLNGGYAGQVGVAKSYKVFPGDQLSIQAYAKYNTSSGTSNLSGFAAALLSAFNLATPGPLETGTPSAGINTWGGLAAGGYGDGTTDNTDPKVFVNIVLFDKNYNFLDVAYAQLTTSGAQMSASYAVKEAGYAYLYVSNENPTLIDVYFDDVTMTYTPTNILQSNDYYAFGLQHATSWTRDNVNNNFLYDAGSELNNTTGMYDLPYRNYDATLGRFFQVDPLSHKSHDLNPYHYAANNPIGANDPSGLMVDYSTSRENEFYVERMRRAWEEEHSNSLGSDNNLWDLSLDFFGMSGGCNNCNKKTTTVTIELDNGVSYDITVNVDGSMTVRNTKSDYGYTSNSWRLIGSVRFVYEGPPSSEDLTGDGSKKRGSLSIWSFKELIYDYEDGTKKVGVSSRIYYSPSEDEKNEYSEFNIIVVAVRNGYPKLTLTNNSGTNEGPYYYGKGESDEWGHYDHTWLNRSDLSLVNESSSLEFVIQATFVGINGNNSTPLGTYYYGYRYNNGKLEVIPPSEEQITHR